MSVDANSACLFGDGWMDGWEVDWLVAYIAKLDQSKFSQRVDTFAANFIRHVKLHHAHVRRAEHGLLGWSHNDGRRSVLPRL